MKVKIINTSISHYYNQVFSNSCLQELRFHKIFLLEIKFLVKLKVGWNWNAIRNVLILIVKEKISIKCPKMSMAIILKKQPENIMKKRNLRRKRNSLKYVLCIFLESPSVFLENKAQSHFFHDWCWHHACSHAHDVVLKLERSFGSVIKPCTKNIWVHFILFNKSIMNNKF